MTTLPRRHLRSRGVSIVTAIFLLVVLSGLGVAVVTLSTTQQRGSTLDLLGSRAYEAARAGVEYGLYQRMINGACAGTTSFVLPGYLSSFTVTVACTSTATAVASGTLTQARITATACNQPAGGACPGTLGPDYVQRVVQVTTQ